LSFLETLTGQEQTSCRTFRTFRGSQKNLRIGSGRIGCRVGPDRIASEIEPERIGSVRISDRIGSGRVRSHIGPDRVGSTRIGSGIESNRIQPNRTPPPPPPPSPQPSPPPPAPLFYSQEIRRSRTVGYSSDNLRCRVFGDILKNFCSVPLVHLRRIVDSVPSVNLRGMFGPAPSIKSSNDLRFRTFI
jgi:hypothetical protein